MLPMRPAVEIFVATANAMEPLLLPLAADVIVIHGTWLTAVHAQPALAVMAALLDPPIAGIETNDGCSETPQAGDGVGFGAPPGAS